MKRWISLGVVAMLACSAVASYGGGFNIWEQGSRATALGGAFAATADDPSAIFYNPAGMAFQPRGFSISVNTSPLNPNISYSLATGQPQISYPGLETNETVSNWFLPSGIYAQYGLEKVQFGLGFFTPFGLGVEWDNKDVFAGRSLSVDAELSAFYLSPVVSYQFSPKLAVGAGVHFVRSHLTLNQIRTANVGTGTDVTNAIDVKLEGSSSIKVGFDAAVMFKPSEKVSLGLNFKQGVDNKFSDGDATFTQVPTGSASIDGLVAQQISALGGDQVVSTTVPYPSFVDVGARYDFSEKFGLMVDWVWFSWSVFDSIELDFQTAPTEVLNEGYEDAWQLRLGAEYQINPQWGLMGGYVRDNTPQPTFSMSPLLPDSDRNDYSLGVIYRGKNEKWNAIAGYMLVVNEDRTTTDNLDGFDASYSSTVNIFTFGFNYFFGGGEQ